MSLGKVSRIALRFHHSMDDSKVGALLEKLSLDPSSQVEDKKTAFQAELKKSGWNSIITPISDHGYYAWRPKGSYKNLSDIGSASDISDFVTLDVKPKNLVTLSNLRLPFAFRNLPAQEHANKFPYGRYEIALLYVASRFRSVDLDVVDFAFGGSALEVFARMEAKDTYMVTRVHHTNTILVAKCKDYVQNYADLGFQFERLVVGESVTEKAEVEFVEHLQLMQVGSHRVLFGAETDALLDGEPAEVKASNPYHWGTKVMFQMISSGSPMLCHGVKSRRASLTGVNLIELSQVARDAFKVQSRSVLEANILSCMASLKNQMEKAKDGEVFKIAFSGGSLRLLPSTTRNGVLLPPPLIVKALIGK